MIEARKVIESLSNTPQTQVSLDDQLRVLIDAANKLGLYDARDWISKVLQP